MIPSIMTFTKMTLMIMIMILSIMTLCIMTLTIAMLDEYAKCHYNICFGSRIGKYLD